MTKPAKEKRNYAFIDGQNLHMGVSSLGWKLDYKKLRVYLAEKYNIEIAYLFVGYVASNKSLYESLQKAGFVLIFKPVIPDGDGKLKGNVDADLVLQAMLDIDKYSQAVIMTSDGDFYSLVELLHRRNKLAKVISPHIKTCSILLRKAAQDKIIFMDNLKQKLEYTKKKHRLRTEP